MIPPALTNALGKAAKGVAKHGAKVVWGGVVLVSTLVVEEYRIYRAKIKARKEGAASGFQTGYSQARKEDIDEIERARTFISKIKNKKNK